MTVTHIHKFGLCPCFPMWNERRGTRVDVKSNTSKSRVNGRQMEELVVQLLEALSGPSSPQLAEVAQAKLAELLFEAEMFPILLKIAAQSDRPIFQKYALVLLRRVILKNGLNGYGSAVETMKSVLCQMLGNEVAYDVKLKACDVIEAVAGCLLPYGQWPQLCQMIPEIIGNQLDIGFYLMERAFSSLPVEMQDSLAVPLVRAFVESVNTPDVDLRINAIHFFAAFAPNVDDPAILGEPTIVVALRTALINAISGLNERDLAAIVSLVCDLCDPHYEFFMEHVAEFMNFALDVMSRDLPLRIRILVHQIVECAVKVYDNGHKEALDGTVQLALQVCADDRASNDYKFCWTFLEFMSLEMLQYIIGSAKQLLEMKDPVPAQVGLLLVSSVIDANGPLVMDFAPEFVEIIFSSVELRDESIFEAVDEFLIELVGTRPQSLSLALDDIVKIYLGKPPVFLKSLDWILQWADRPPSSAPEIITHMMKVILEPSLHPFRGDAVSCISSVLSKQMAGNGKYDELACQLLGSDIAMDVELRPEILGLLSVLVRVAPKVLKSQLVTVLQLVDSSISPSDYRLTKEAVKCMTWIFRRLPETVKEQSEHVYQVLWSVYHLPFEQDVDGNEELFAEFLSLRNSSLLRLAWFVTVFQTHQDTIVPLIIDQVREDQNACLAATICLDILPDPSLLLSLDEIPFSCLKTVIESFGFGENLDDILSRILSDLFATDALACLDAVILRAGREIISRASVISGNLMKVVQVNESGELQGHALKCLASLAVACNDGNAIQQVAEILLEKSKTANLSLTQSTLASFRRILSSHRSVIEQVIPMIVEIASSHVKCGICGPLFDEASIVLLLVSPEMELSSVKDIFSKLLLADVTDGFVVIAQRACEIFARSGAAFAEEISRIAVTALTSSKFIWTSLPGPIRDQLKAVIQEIGVESVMNLLDFDEYRFGLLRQRM